MMGRGDAWPKPVRAHAIELAREHGPAEAHRRMGEAAPPQGTIRRWMMEEGYTKPPAGVDPAVWAERKETGAGKAWEAADKALKECLRWVKSGDPARARNASIVYGVLVDKTVILERQAAEARAREEQAAIEFAEQQGEAIAKVIQTVVHGLFGVRFALDVVYDELGRILHAVGVAEQASKANDEPLDVDAAVAAVPPAPTVDPKLRRRLLHELLTDPLLWREAATMTTAKALPRPPPEHSGDKPIDYTDPELTGVHLRVHRVTVDPNGQPNGHHQVRGLSATVAPSDPAERQGPPVDPSRSW